MGSIWLLVDTRNELKDIEQKLEEDRRYIERLKEERQ